MARRPVSEKLFRGICSAVFLIILGALGSAVWEILMKPHVKMPAQATHAKGPLKRAK